MDKDSVLSNSILYYQRRVDIVSRLISSGLSPTVQSNILARLKPLELRRCQLVSKTWHAAVEALWDHAEPAGAARRWAETGRPAGVRTAQCRRDRAVCTVSDLAMDDRLLACALASSGKVEVWDRDSMKRLWSTHAHDGGVYSVDLGGADADGRVLASGGDDAAVRLWSARDGVLLRTLLCHEYIVWSVKLFLNSLVSCSYDCSVAFWDISDQDGQHNAQLIKKIKGPLRWADGLSVDGLGRRLGAVDEETFQIGVWYTDQASNVDNVSYECANDPAVTLAGHTDEVNCLRFTPADSDMAVSGSSDQTVRVWSLSKGGSCLRVLEGMGGKVWSVDVDGRRVAAAGRRGRVGAWAMEEEEEDKEWKFKLLKLPHGPATAVGQVKLDGGCTLVTADGLGQVVVADFWRPIDGGEEEEEEGNCEGCGKKIGTN